MGICLQLQSLQSRSTTVCLDAFLTLTRLATGFVFYTNYSSRKGSELSATGHAAFSMYWEKLQRQIR